ncbi:MAG: hypothetical protein ACRD0K_14395 [Egibacteraceae bacterium]
MTVKIGTHNGLNNQGFATQFLKSTLDLTAFDPQSAMRYFCGGMGLWELKITQIDQQGSQQVCGLSLIHEIRRRGPGGPAQARIGQGGDARLQTAGR